MPSLERDGARIHYSVHGSGFPVLTLAPGGMRSAGDFWSRMPWDPVAELAENYQVITMDQRNAGSSTAPVDGTESWHTYTADQLAVLDHLGVPRCHLVGMCIGGPFILNLLRTAPERVAKVVALQPIGLNDNREAFHQMFDGWATELRPAHPEAGEQQWAAYRGALYDGPDVLFSVPESFLATIDKPMLVLRGNDLHHPGNASELLASSVPGATLVQQWKEPEQLPATRATIAGFLAAD